MVPVIFLTFLLFRPIHSNFNNENYRCDRDIFSNAVLNSIYLRPAVVEGVIGLHAGEPLNTIKAAQCVHLPTVSGHLVSPAPSIQRLNLDPFVQGAVVLPYLVLSVFTSCNDTNWSKNVSDFHLKCEKGKGQEHTI